MLRIILFIGIVLAAFFFGMLYGDIIGSHRCKNVMQRHLEFSEDLPSIETPESYARTLCENLQ